jgi:SAM-dependent methyltransferase
VAPKSNELTSTGDFLDPLKKEKINKIRIPDRPFTLQNKAMCFLPGNRTPAKSAGNGFLATIQEFLKKLGRLYYFFVSVFAPVFLSKSYHRHLNALLSRHDQAKIIINLGSGPAILKNRRDIINIDIFSFNEVDIIADAIDLPIKDQSVDFVINRAMLEHVSDPQKIENEIHRILKKDGEFFCCLPFIQPFHAAPDDFYRWTSEGAKHSFQQFAKISVSIAAGPTSGMLWVIQEWLAIVLSFGSRTLHDMIFMLLMILTAPIKLLDIIFIHFPHAEKIASVFIVTGKK